jgi:hypothetical protein
MGGLSWAVRNAFRMEIWNDWKDNLISCVEEPSDGTRVFLNVEKKVLIDKICNI